MVDNFAYAINAKKSKFKKTTDKYTIDNTFDIIDIEEAINKNKLIRKCEKENFIYFDHLVKDKRKSPNLKLEEYYFEKDNGTYENFTDYFEEISFLGAGGFGSVIRAYDKKNKFEVAIKVRKSFIFRSFPKDNTRIRTTHFTPKSIIKETSTILIL
jgi:hypothetical protein